jgi:eukaryotic-like serine/threonine-protein kinase
MSNSSSQARWQRLHKLFDEAWEKSPAEQKEFLENLKKEDADMAKELEELFQAAEDSKHFLDDPIGLHMVEAVLVHSRELTSRDQLEDFLVVRKIGEGSFATVYLALQTSLSREVALKVTVDPTEEARTMALLEHDNIVQVFSQHKDIPRGLHLLCMQYVPGVTLQEVISTTDLPRDFSGENLLKFLDSKKLTTKFDAASATDREKLRQIDSFETLLIFSLQLAKALAYAHSRGVLHLDIKPANILINPYGRPLLSDFNVSMSERLRSTHNYQWMGGTMKYMSPEQERALKDPSAENFGNIQERSDIYSLGVVLGEWAEKIDLKSLPSSVQRAWESFFSKCTAQQVEDRFPTVEEVLRSLSHLLNLHQMERELPKPSFLVRVGRRFPGATLFTVLMGPQVVSGIVNILYNGSQIVSRLNPEQQSLFHTLVLFWNPFIYGLCTALLLPGFLPLYRLLQKSITDNSLLEKGFYFPKRLFLVTTMGWTAAFLFFPGTLTVFSGGLTGGTWIHFFISFLLSWLIGVAHSIFLTQVFLMCVALPIVVARRDLSSSPVVNELPRLAEESKRYLFLGGAIPILGALLLIVMAPENLTYGSYSDFRVLIGSLMVMGLFGFLLNIRLYPSIPRTLHALSPFINKKG